MQRFPRVGVVSVVVGVVVCGALFLFLRNSLDLQSMVPRVQSPATSTPTQSPGMEKAKLVFTFTDPTIAPLVDERENAYTFYIRNQFIGIREMQPEKPEEQKSFSAWVEGLNGTIRMGQTTVPITRITVAGHDAIAFETTEADVHAANIITEVSGHVLLLQSQTNQDVLEEFLRKIESVRE